MQLTLYTDYTFRTLIYLAIHDENATISDIANYYGISRNHLVKVINNLGKLNYIQTTRGRSGGLKLNVPPEKINLADVALKVEPNFHLVECFDSEHDTCPITPVCGLAGVLKEAHAAFIDTLRQYQLSDIIVNKKALLSITGIQVNLK